LLPLVKRNVVNVFEKSSAFAQTLLALFIICVSVRLLSRLSPSVYFGFNLTMTTSSLARARSFACRSNESRTPLCTSSTWLAGRTWLGIWHLTPPSNVNFFMERPKSTPTRYALTASTVDLLEKMVSFELGCVRNRGIISEKGCLGKNVFGFVHLLFVSWPLVNVGNPQSGKAPNLCNFQQSFGVFHDFFFQAVVCTAHDSRLFFVTRLHWTCLIRLLVATDF